MNIWDKFRVQNLVFSVICILKKFWCVSKQSNFSLWSPPVRLCLLIFRLWSIISHFQNWELCSKLGRILCWRDYWWYRVLRRKRVRICLWLMKAPQTGSKFLLKNVYAIDVQVQPGNDKWARQHLFKRGAICVSYLLKCFGMRLLTSVHFPLSSLNTFLKRWK